jgi:arsenate reductase
MKTVLFACVHNAGRSQMAAAWFNELAAPENARAISAGTQPGARLHSEAVESMREVGIDLAAVRGRSSYRTSSLRADWLITMGCGEACPVVLSVSRDDWPLEDPKSKSLEHVRQIGTRCGGTSRSSFRATAGSARTDLHQGACGAPGTGNVGLASSPSSRAWSSKPFELPTAARWGSSK